MLHFELKIMPLVTQINDQPQLEFWIRLCTQISKRSMGIIDNLVKSCGVLPLRDTSPLVKSWGIRTPRHHSIGEHLHVEKIFFFAFFGNWIFRKKFWKFKKYYMGITLSQHAVLMETLKFRPEIQVLLLNVWGNHNCCALQKFTKC